MNTRRYFHNKRLLIGALILFSLTALQVGLALYGVMLTGADYQRAALTYVLDHPLAFWMGYQESIPFAANLSMPMFGFFAMFPIYGIPILLAFACADTASADRNAKMVDILKTRAGTSKYIFYKAIFVFLVSLIMIFVMLLLQLILSFLAISVVKGVPGVEVLASEHILDVIAAGLIKVPLFYASLICFSFSISLYLPSYNLISYLLPCVISQIAIMLMSNLTHNTAYYLMSWSHGLAQPVPYWYWVEVGVKLAGAIILTGIFCMKSKRV